MATGAPAQKVNTLIDYWLGERLRELRKQKGLSLQALAQASGISTGTLSQVERGLTSASIKTLSGIARALDTPLNQLVGNFEEPHGDADGWVARTGTHRRLQSRDHRIRKEILTPPQCSTADLYQAFIQPGGSSSDERYSTSMGEIVGVVIAGRLELWIEDRHIVLEAGDSFCYQGNAARRWCNPGTEPTHVIWYMQR